mmetsp:Transcript_24417/g.57890  ORF Transcript_24417/g.57890 Transcript_24417/m.57890 type:complete len:421 (+) Transcript_24417:320-1582(+)
MVPESSHFPSQPPLSAKAVETPAPVRCQDAPNDSYDEYMTSSCLMLLDELIPISSTADVTIRESNASFSSIVSSSTTTSRTSKSTNMDSSCSDFNSSLSSLGRESTTSSSASLPSRQSGNIMLPSDYQPSDTDVICARGRSGWDHPGNVHYRQLVADATPRYSQATNKLQKSLIVSEIVQSVHDRLGKFIKRKNKRCSWVQVDETFHREKIGQSLRDSTMIMMASATPEETATFMGPASRQYYKSATSVKKQQQQQQKRRRQSEDRTTAAAAAATTANRNKSSKTNVLHGDNLDRLVLSNATIAHQMDELREKLQLRSCFSSSSSSSSVDSNSNLFDPSSSSSVGATSAVTSNQEEEDSMSLALFTETNSSILETIKRDMSMSNQYDHSTTTTDKIDESSAPQHVGGTASRQMMEMNLYF